MTKANVRYMGGIICNSSAVDQNTQSLSVFNVIDELTVDVKALDPSKMPPPGTLAKINVPINFQVITLWKRNNLSDQDKDIVYRLEVEILDPLGDSLGKNVIEAPIPAGKKRSRYILNVNGIAVTTTGEYLFQFRETRDNGERSEVLTALTLDVVVNKS